MRVAVIANPVSGRGRGRQAAELLATALLGRGHKVELRITRAPGEAAALAAELDPDTERIVVAGGDGTLNEVVNGLPDPARIPLAPLAVGTANMLARELRLPKQPEALVRVLERGSVERMDLAVANGQRFVGVAGVGFDAWLTQAVQQHRGRRLGFSGWVLPILRTLWHYQQPQLRVCVDDGPCLASGFVVVANLANYGGLFRVAPAAGPTSGDLQLCVLGRARVREIARLVWPAMRGRIATCRGVQMLSAQRVRIVAEGVPVPVQLDGDPAGTTPLEVQLLPRALRVVIPTMAAC